MRTKTEASEGAKSTTTNIWKAIADFQQEVPIIHKDTQGYGYTYADLSKIVQVITPYLKKHNLGYVQPLEDNGRIRTIIFHTETGETLESVVQIPQGVQLKGMNEFQVLGSAISYLRRYSISSFLGLVTDKDIDASGVQTPTAKDGLSNERFEKACEAIASGTYTKEALLEQYALTSSQKIKLQAI